MLRILFRNYQLCLSYLCLPYSVLHLQSSVWEASVALWMWPISPSCRHCDWMGTRSAVRTSPQSRPCACGKLPPLRSNYVYDMVFANLLTNTVHSLTCATTSDTLCLWHMPKLKHSRGDDITYYRQHMAAVNIHHSHHSESKDGHMLQWFLQMFVKLYQSKDKSWRWPGLWLN